MGDLNMETLCVHNEDENRKVVKYETLLMLRGNH